MLNNIDTPFLENDILIFLLAKDVSALRTVGVFFVAASSLEFSFLFRCSVCLLFVVLDL